MASTQFIEQVYIEYTQGDIMGSYQHIPPEHMANLMVAEVDDSLFMPDMFTLRFLDPGLKLLTADLFKLGTKIKFSIKPSATPGASENPTVTEIMRGEITSIEPELNPEERSVLTLRGYDLSHKLNRGKKTQTFQQMTDSSIAQRMAQGAGLLASVQSSGITYPYLMQANQTDWEFLLERARRIGFRVWVEGKTLHFKPPPPSPSVTVPLKWGLDMAEFRARMTTIDQPGEAVVRGWNPSTKQPIVGRATSPDSTLYVHTISGRNGGAAAKQAHAQAGKIEIVDAPVYSQGEADKIAKAALTRSLAGHVQGEGVAGDPRLKAGNGVNIDGIGARFGGDYLIVRSVHRYSHKEYSVRFWVSGGLGSMGMAEILRNSNGHSSSNGIVADKPTLRGVMVGLVTNNKDPENMGRVKVKFPQLGDNIESYWCRMASVMAGPTRGVAFFPEANDEVVVAFANGDPNHGYVLGCVWNGSDKLPKPPGELVTGGQTIRRIIKSRVGHYIELDDSPSPSEGIIIQDKTGNNLIKIITKKNKIEIQAHQDCTVTSSTGKIEVSALQDVSVKSSTGKVSITATTGVDINAGAGMVNIKGSMINLN